ncbi:MAG: S8 family serine peptidase [Streptosporangiaceae bacterium]
MAQRLRSRATAAVAAGLAAACIGVAAAPAFADTVRDQEWWLTSLHVTQAWLSSRGTGVTVAVLDTGVDPTQPDLAGSVTTGPDFTSSGRTAGGPFWGVHGTAMASIIAGHGHGPHHADGIVGVAPQAKILSVRVTLENKDPLLASPTVVAALPTAIARGIRYAVRHGAQVIDLPLDPAAQAGGTTPGGSPAERSAVEAALAKGVVLVAPSGDNGAGSDTINYPAAYPGVISVGAFSQGFVKAPFTNQQPYATLTAAGNGVIAANGLAGYAKLKTTSAASAVVAGIAALIRSQFPTLAPAQVEQALTSSTAFRHTDGRKDGSGFGTADAAAALLAAANINATPTSSASPGTAGNPTPPAPPKVHVTTKSLWQAVRIPVLGLVALVLLALIILISVRVRQRRALDAQLAPLQAAARASRAQAAAGMTGMGSPGPGYGPPPGAAVPGRVPASSEPGHGSGNFGLASAGPDDPGLAGRVPAGTGAAGWAAATGFTSGGPGGGGRPGSGRPLSGSVARPAVSGKPPWEAEDDEPAAPAPAPPQPDRAEARFLLPGRGLGSMDAAGSRPASGGSAGGGSADGGPARASSRTDSSPPGSEGTSTLNLGGWSLGKPSGGTGRVGARNGAPDAGSTPAGSTPTGSTGTWKAATGNTGRGNATTESTGTGSPGPLTGIGGTGSNRAAAEARARFGPSPFDDPSFEIPALGPSAAGSSPLDDRAFGEPVPGRPTVGAATPGAFSLGTPPPGKSAPGAPADAVRAAPPAGNAGSRGPGRHGAARGVAGGNSPGTTSGAGLEGPAAGWTGDGPPAAVPPLGTAQRLNPVRAPAASGHPPWEPAEKPASELPWMDAPGSGQGRLVPPRRAFPVNAEGPAAGPAVSGVGTVGLGAGGLGAGGLGASGLGAGGLGADRTGADWPLAPSRPADQPPATDSGLARRGPKSQSPFPELIGPPPGMDPSPGSRSGEDAEGTSRPMYSWNPSDTTEAFPAVPPPGDSRPG